MASGRAISSTEGIVVGATAAAGAALVSLMVRTLWGGPALPELVLEGIVRALPGPVFSFVLDRLAFLAKPLLFLAILLGQLALGGAIGLAYTSRPRPARSAAALGAATYLLLVLVVLPAAGAGALGLGRTAEAPVWLTTLVATAAFVVLLHRLAVRPMALAATPDRTRRRLLRLGAAGASLAVTGVVGWRALATATRPVATAEPAASVPVATEPRLAAHPTPLVTPVGDFYTVSKNMVDPVVSAAGWTVQVGGMVERPLTLTLDDLKALAAVEQPATLGCISNEIGGDLIGNGVWKGVRLADVLARAGVQPGAAKVMFECRDDYRDSIALGRALLPGTIVAYEMNGARLTDRHGFPARVIVPGIYGMKNAKWLEKILLVGAEQRGYWQRQGWSDPAPYQTLARIDFPRGRAPLTTDAGVVYGVAFAGDRGIQRVEVSTDGGGSWADARLVPALGPFTWVRWSFPWRPAADQRYTILARATDGTGARQIDTVAEPFPDGATGYHQVEVQVASD